MKSNIAYSNLDQEDQFQDEHQQEIQCTFNRSPTSLAYSNYTTPQTFVYGKEWDTFFQDNFQEKITKTYAQHFISKDCAKNSDYKPDEPILDDQYFRKAKLVKKPMKTRIIGLRSNNSQNEAVVIKKKPQVRPIKKKNSLVKLQVSQPDPADDFYRTMSNMSKKKDKKKHEQKMQQIDLQSSLDVNPILQHVNVQKLKTYKLKAFTDISESILKNKESTTYFHITQPKFKLINQAVLPSLVKKVSKSLALKHSRNSNRKSEEAVRRLTHVQFTTVRKLKQYLKLSPSVTAQFNQK